MNTPGLWWGPWKNSFHVPLLLGCLSKLVIYGVGVCCGSIILHPWLKFYFILFLGMVMYMYDNAFETKKIKFKPRMELNHN